jgi:hypothetical protein
VEESALVKIRTPTPYRVTIEKINACLSGHKIRREDDQFPLDIQQIWPKPLGYMMGRVVGILGQFLRVVGQHFEV